MSLKLRAKVRLEIRVISVQVVIELWVCMSSCKKKIIYRTVDQRVLVFKRQEKEESLSKERKKITEDDKS